MSSVSPHTAPGPWLAALPRHVPLAVVWLAMAAGCGDPAAVRPGDVRRYAVPREVMAPVAPRPEPTRPTTIPIRYAVPPGWTDQGGSGMRLATLAIGAPADGHEVTIIPASGSLESNVTRWLGQLDPEASAAALAERSATAIAAAEEVEIDGGQATIVTLGEAANADSESDAAGDAILAGVIPLDEAASLFVKFKGPAAVARRERENFVRFVSSIRWK